MKKVWLYDDIMSVAEYISKCTLNSDNVKIIIEVENEAALQKINEDFFYRNDENKNSRPEKVDEINVSILGVNFTYVVKNSEEEEEND